MAGKALEGQVALITGAAKRIGRSIALRLAADGAAIVVNYATSKAEADALVQEIGAGGSRAQAGVLANPDTAALVFVLPSRDRRFRAWLIWVLPNACRKKTTKPSTPVARCDRNSEQHRNRRRTQRGRAYRLNPNRERARPSSAPV